jgi:hypothetical protein
VLADPWLHSGGIVLGMNVLCEAGRRTAISDTLSEGSLNGCRVVKAGNVRWQVLFTATENLPFLVRGLE